MPRYAATKPSLSFWLSSVISSLSFKVRFSVRDYQVSAFLISNLQKEQADQIWIVYFTVPMKPSSLTRALSLIDSMSGI